MKERTKERRAQAQGHSGNKANSRKSPGLSDINLDRKGAEEGVAVVDRQGALIYASPIFARYHGYDTVDLVGMNLKDFVPDLQKSDLSTFLNCVRSEKITTWKAEHVKRDGSSFRVSASAIPLPVGESQSDYFFLIIRDEESQDSRVSSGGGDNLKTGDEEGYRRFFDRSLTGLYRMTLDGAFLEVNERFAHIFGFENERELLQRPAKDLYDNQGARADFINLITRLDYVSNYREAGRRKDGKRIRTLENARLIRDEMGNPICIEGTVLDITDIFEAEERNRVYIRALEEAHSAILIATMGGHIQYANRAASELYGYSSESLIEMNLGDLVSPKDREKLRKLLSTLLESREWSGEMAQLTSQNEERVVDLAMSVVPDSEGNPRALVACARDVSALRTLEVQLRQAQKMEAVGLLASGLAHNINSPLSAIIMTTEMAQTKHPEIPEFNDILQAAGRIGEIISNLMAKSRQEQSTTETELDVNQLVQTELKFLEANLFFKHNVELDVCLAPDLPKIRGLYSDFSQCFQNIVQNALDAMSTSSESRLLVRTQFDEVENRIVLSIRDTGCGIPEEHVTDIFKPFFTTKGGLGAVADQLRPSGTGLGLSTAHQLLSKYGAEIGFESCQGLGSEFRIYIPIQSGEGGTA